MKNVFLSLFFEKCFFFLNLVIFNAFFIFKIFKFLSWLFGHVEKQLDQKDKVNFKIYEFTAWLTNKCNTHITQYLQK